MRLLLLLVACANTYQLRREVAARVESLPAEQRAVAAVHAWRTDGTRTWLRWDALRVPAVGGSEVPARVARAPERGWKVIAGALLLVSSSVLVTASANVLALGDGDARIPGICMMGVGAASLVVGSILLLAGRRDRPDAEVDPGAEWTYYDDR